MAEWWTYSLSDFLMFSPRAYGRLVESYHQELWPAHLLAFGAGLLAALLTRRHPRVALLLLAAAWLWVAWAFFWERFAEINLAAPWFAGACAAQAVLLAAAALLPPRPLTPGAWVAWPLPEPLAIATLATAWRRWWLCVIPAALLAASAAMYCVMATVCR